MDESELGVSGSASRGKAPAGSDAASLRPGTRVTICGSVSCDVVHRHGRATRQIGGTVWFAGVTLAALGIRVRVLTRLGTADRGVARAFCARHVEVRSLPTSSTTTFHNIYGPGGRDDRRQRVDAIAEPLPFGAVASALADADLCYLGALHPADLSAEALAFLQRRCEVPIAMDVQGFTRHLDGARVRAAVAPDLAALLASCCVVKASNSEACLITGEADAERAAVGLAEMVSGGEVLVTSGANGAVLVRGGTVHRRAAVPLDDPDPTGAGDILLAAYLARRLGGEAPEPALDFAVTHTAARLSAVDRSVLLPA